ncbi:MAG: type IV secretory system conjugative DNA transfer family protein [Wenzhouxiangellaceae bacterium]
MRALHLITLFLYSAFTLTWQFLPAVSGIVGLIVFGSPPWFGGVMAAVLALAGVLIKRTVGFFWHAPDSHGSARFADLDDIRRGRLLRRKGQILGRKSGRMLRYAGDGHLLTFAPTRSGKGVSCVIPNLLDHRGSVVVTDIKGENSAITSPWRHKLGPVYEIAPLGGAATHATFNPLDFIRMWTVYEIDDARLVAEMLVVPEHAHPNHWEREARTLITGLLLYIRHHLGTDQQDPGTLRDLLMRDAEDFELLIAEMALSRQDSVARIARGFSQKEPKERSAVVSTAQGATELFESPELRDATATSSFTFESLKEQVASVYVIIPPEYLESYRPFLRLVIGLATAAMTRNKTRPKHPVLFMLDELPALGYMRPIEEGIGYLAGYSAKMWLFVQDLDQLQKTYPKARSIIANCAVRQAFNVQDPDTARLLSDMLGTATVKMHSAGQSSALPFRLLTAAFHSGVFEGARQLMTTGEILTMPGKQQLLFVQGLRAIKAKKIRYFDWREWWLKRRATKLED